MLKKTITKEKALLKLASLCAKSEQCEFEITRKLINWGISSSDRNEIITYLKENKYIEDVRFAKSFANDKARFSSWGPVKIKAELMRRKIKPAVIKEAIENVSSLIWKEALLKSVLSKGSKLELNGQEGYGNCQKLYRYLIGRGFSSGAASKAVSFMKKKQESL